MFVDIRRTDSRYAAPVSGFDAPPLDLEGPRGAMDSGLAGIPDATKPSQEQIQVLVRSMTLLASDTIAVEFVPADEIELPAFEAGAHVDLLLPNGIRRSYS